MAIAQGINKTLIVAKQAALLAGISPTSTNFTAATGKQILRRETGMGKLTLASFDNNEITTHQQSTGKQHGVRSASYALNGVLSGNTYSMLMASLIRKAFAAVTAPTITNLTVAGTSGAYTLTVSSTTGLRVGDIIRISGTGLNADSTAKNLLITGLTSTVITVTTLNGTTLTTASNTTTAGTITIVGKKAIAAKTSQTQEYWLIEEFQSDITQSEVFSDMVVSSMDIGLPASGNVTIATNFVGLNRTTFSAQQITSPTAATTSTIVTAVQGDILIKGVSVANITGATLKIDCAAASMGGVVGTNYAPDVQRGIVSVSGQFTAYYADATFPNYFDASTDISIVLAVAVDSSATSEFISFVLPSVVLDGDDKDDGQKGIIRTYPFTARLPPVDTSASTTNPFDHAIIVIQDSLA